MSPRRSGWMWKRSDVRPNTAGPLPCDMEETTIHTSAYSSVRTPYVRGLWYAGTDFASRSARTTARHGRIIAPT